MKQLSVRDLTVQIQARQLKRHQIFDKILEMCYNNIKRNADKSQLFCLFEVPEFVIGMPLYDLNECITYLVEKLKNSEFLVKYYFPKVLYISWNINEINENNLQNQLQLIKSIEAPPKLLPAKEPRKKKTQQVTNRQQASQVPAKQVGFVKSVKEFKPSGKIVLDI